MGKKPIFGICLGHQILSIVLGARTEQMPFGHHGANHPVRDLTTGRVEITSQNHSFAVLLDSMPADLELTHLNLNDQTVEGMRHKRMPVFSVQYHPEAAPGPLDSSHLFQRFRELVEAKARGVLVAVGRSSSFAHEHLERVAQVEARAAGEGVAVPELEVGV